MPVSDGFVAFVLEQLEPIGPLTPKQMFGGVGLYAGDLFFALLAGDVLYLKAGEATRAALEQAGARPFQPYPDRSRGSGTMQYYSVPAAILEDGDELIMWAKRSVAIATVQRRVKALRHDLPKEALRRAPKKRSAEQRADGRRPRRG